MRGVDPRSRVVHAVGALKQALAKAAPQPADYQYVTGKTTRRRRSSARASSGWRLTATPTIVEA